MTPAPGGPVRRRVNGTTYCQSEVCNDMTCKATHIGGVSVFSMGPLPRMRMAVDLLDGLDLDSEVEVLYWWFGGGDIPEGSVAINYTTVLN